MNFHFTPILNGEVVSLRPISTSDFDELFEVASDADIWEQHPNPLLYTEIEFKKYFDGAVKSNSAFAIISNEDNSIIGTSRYYGYNSEKREVVIGYTFIAKKYWGRGVNREIKDLMIEHALNYVDSVVFHVAKSNIRSRKAVEKLGAVLFFEGEKENSYGKILDYCFYRLTKLKFKEKIA